MPDRSHVLIHNVAYDRSAAVGHHYGGFPPGRLDLNDLLMPLSEAIVALTRVDTMIRGLRNSELLPAPLRARDAVVSSRMEGTISTLEEVLRIEAEARDQGLLSGSRDEAIEVALYVRAIRQSEGLIREGYPLSEHMIRGAHRILLSHGRGAEKNPGEYKLRQNYIGDAGRRRIDFEPIGPEHLPAAMRALVDFIRDDTQQPLLEAAIAHAEFEALHPFDDGNGRLGRMLITLMLWTSGVLGAPHFFVSDFFERNKPEYIERLRAVSAQGDWVGWCRFFLAGLHAQALDNLDVVARIQTHYEDMRGRFRDILRSRWAGDALDFVFENPIFLNSRFTRDAGIPKFTANSFTNRLVAEGLLRVLVRPAGRAPGLYAFPSLLAIVQEPR